jgi:hypothetical protein
LKQQNSTQKANVSVLGNWVPYLKLKILSSRQTKVVGRPICTITTATTTYQNLFAHNVLYVQANGGLSL